MALYLYNSGCCSLKLEKYNECEANFAESLTICKNIGEGLMGDQIAKKSNQIGLRYLEQGHFTDALKYFGSAISIQKRVSKQESVDQILVSCYFHKGLRLLEMKECNKAKAHFEASLTIHKNLGEKLMGKEITDISCLIDLCHFHLRQSYEL